MKVEVTEQSILLSHGPTYGAGILSIIFGMPFLFGGFISVSAYFGFVPADSSIGINGYS